MKKTAIKQDCTEPEVGLFVIDWQQGWLDPTNVEDQARKRAVESHLMDCSACISGVAMMDELKTVLQQHPDLLDEPERYLPRERVAMVPRWRAVTALAAGLIMGAALSLTWRPGGNISDPGTGRVADSLRETAADGLSHARAAYTDGRYSDVIAALRPAANHSKLSPEGLYYLGLAYAGMGDRRSACVKLEQAAQNSAGPLCEDALWALAQSLVADGQTDAARAPLAKLAQSPRHGRLAAALEQELIKGTCGGGMR